MYKKFDKAESFWKAGGGTLSYEWGPITVFWAGCGGFMGSLKFYDKPFKNLLEKWSADDSLQGHVFHLLDSPDHTL